MNKREILRQLKEKKKLLLQEEPFEDEMGNLIASTYLGSFMSLDPCGRYHHVLSPNRTSVRCNRFWENMEDAAEEIGCWIAIGEGDPTEVYFQIIIERNKDGEDSSESI